MCVCVCVCVCACECVYMSACVCVCVCPFDNAQASFRMWVVYQDNPCHHPQDQRDGFVSCCRAKSAHTRQSRPDSGLALSHFPFKICKAFSVDPFSLGGGSHKSPDFVLTHPRMYFEQRPRVGRLAASCKELQRANAGTSRTVTASV